MWKRTLACFSLLSWFFLSFTSPSYALCGIDATLPEGGLIWPVSGPVLNGWSLDCATDRGHRGIDISMAGGGSVMAAAGGTVAFVGFTPAEAGGITVSITHGNLRSTYLQLVAASVSTGDHVSRGEIIGQGKGALHFGLKSDRGNTYYNPFDYLPHLQSAAAVEQTSPPVAAHPVAVFEDTLPESSPGASLNPALAASPVKEPATHPLTVQSTAKPVQDQATLSAPEGDAVLAVQLMPSVGLLAPRPPASILAAMTTSMLTEQLHPSAVTLPPMSIDALSDNVRASRQAGFSGKYTPRHKDAASQGIVIAAAVMLIGIPAAACRLLRNGAFGLPQPSW